MSSSQITARRSGCSSVVSFVPLLLLALASSLFIVLVPGVTHGASAVMSHERLITQPRQGGQWRQPQLTSTMPTSPTLTFLPEISIGRAREVTAAGSHACVLAVTGSVQCWGRNDYGQTGATPTSGFEVAPVQVLGLQQPVTVLAAGAARSARYLSCQKDMVPVETGDVCALNASGSLQCWSRRYDAGGAVRTVLSAGVIDVAKSGTHGCALLRDHSVVCWGGNSTGELGDGTTEPRSSPVQVIGLGGPVVDITTGTDEVGAHPLSVASPGSIFDTIAVSHSCALLQSGDVQCWGSNHVGQLGDGQGGWNRYSTQPVTVPGIDGQAVQIHTTGGSTCVLLRSGAVKCWGASTWIGSPCCGSTVKFGLTPVTIKDIAVPIVQLYDYGGVDNLGRLWRWQGYLQSPMAVIWNTPRPVATYAVGWDSECMTATDGSAWCNGYNGKGELGDGRGGLIREQPVEVYKLDTGVVSVTAGRRFACAGLGDGSVRCWGNNFFGQLGSGSTADSTIPTRTIDLPTVVQVSAGNAHACARTANGAVECWGMYNAVGLPQEPGFGPVPVEVVGLAGPVTDLAVGSEHTCAVLEDGTVQCWGYNDYHQSGDSAEIAVQSPLTRTHLAGPAKLVAAGGHHSCALLLSGAVQCWGGNEYGQLGIGTISMSETLPITVTGLTSGVVDLAAGGYHTCALMENGKVRCWGVGQEGVFRFDEVPVQTTPLEVPNVDGVAVLAAGGDVYLDQYATCPFFDRYTVVARTCARTTAGAVQCWGMGQGTPPATPAGLERGVATVGVALDFACAVMNTGGVRCWGRNDYGQLGNASPQSPFWMQVLGY